MAGKTLEEIRELQRKVDEALSHALNPKNKAKRKKEEILKEIFGEDYC